MQEEISHDANDTYCMAVEYKLEPDKPNCLVFVRCSQLDNITSSTRPSNGSANVVLVRGCPSPDWVSGLGATYDIDPEFFYRHLNFFVTLDSRHAYSLPSLASMNMITIPVTTILHRDRPTVRTHSQAQAARAQEFSDLSVYHRHFPKSSTCGDSIVRQFSSLDENHALVEQQISVFLGEKEDGWFGSYPISKLFESFLTTV